MLDPMGKNEFEKTGRLISAAENIGNKITCGILNKLFSKGHDDTNDWKTDASWAMDEQRPINTAFFLLFFCFFFGLLFHLLMK